MGTRQCKVCRKGADFETRERAIGGPLLMGSVDHWCILHAPPNARRVTMGGEARRGNRKR